MFFVYTEDGVTVSQQYERFDGARKDNYFGGKPLSSTVVELRVKKRRKEVTGKLIKRSDREMN